MKRIPAVLLLVLVTMAAYWASFPGTFHYDDFPLLLESPRVTGASFDYGSFAQMYGGRPLTLWSFFLQYRLSGADPAAFHAVNVLLHALVGILLFLVVRRWSGSEGLALGTALVFIVHPAQAQVVDYVWARSLLLMSAFGLAAMLLVRRHPWWALLALQLAVWSRAEALVLLVPLILLDRRILKPGLALAGLDVAGFVYGFVLASPAEFAWTYTGWVAFWLRAPVNLLQYLGWMIGPSRFSVYHGPSSVSPIHVLVGLGALAGLAVATLIAGRRFALAWIGIGWACLLLLPSVLVPNSEPFSESRAYLALAGPAWTGVWLMRHAVLRLGKGLSVSFLRRGLEPALLTLVVLAGLTLTQSRHRVWQDDVALWREAVAAEPAADLAAYNLAVALSKRGRTEEACRYFARAVDLNPLDDMSYSGLGYCAEVNGQISQAAEYYSHALSLNAGSDYAREALSRLGSNPDQEGAKP
jgi:hypothetical protein